LAFSYWFDKPWFLSEGKLAAVLITPSLGVSQLVGHLHQHRTAINVQYTHLVINIVFLQVT
jgi:hypothetical protein